MKKIIIISSLVILFINSSFKSEPEYTEITISNSEYISNEVIEADKIILKSGGCIRIKNGASLTIVASKELVVEGTFTIRGQGETGETGSIPAEWSTQCRGGFWEGFGTENMNEGHKEWEHAGSAVDTGGKGGKGGNGATVKILYGSISGIVGGLTNIQCYMNGGAGGAGGRGRALKCGCCGSIKYGANGASGEKGSDGKFAFKQITQ